MSYIKFAKLGIAAGALTSLVALSPAFAADGLNGVNVLVSNTFTGKVTKGVETDVGMFGMNNNLFSTVGESVEFPSFIDLYDIDVKNSSICFNWVETETSAKFGGKTPAGNNDRNYLVFGLPAGKAITSIKFDAANSKLLKGSAEPTAQALTSNKVVTSFAEGVIRSPGFAPCFSVSVGDAKMQ